MPAMLSLLLGEAWLAPLSTCRGRAKKVVTAPAPARKPRREMFPADGEGIGCCSCIVGWDVGLRLSSNSKVCRGVAHGIVGGGDLDWAAIPQGDFHGPLITHPRKGMQPWCRRGSAPDNLRCSRLSGDPRFGCRSHALVSDTTPRVRCPALGFG
jgi:hypothetical protein